MNPEYFIIPLIMGQVGHIINKFNTGNCFIDVFMILGCFMLYKSTNINHVRKYLHRLLCKSKNKNTVIIQSTKCNSDEEECSTKFKSVMHHINMNVRSVYKVRELQKNSWHGDDDLNMNIESDYIADQSAEIKIKDDLFCVVETDVQERNRPIGGTERIVYTILKIYSYSRTIRDIQEWLKTVTEEYKKHIKSSSVNSQLYISLTPSGQHKTKKGEGDKKWQDFQAIDWESSITFENSYFRDMESIIKKIDFFLNNKQWYIDKGIPYNLGIMLYGEPGCGKTRFIKQMANRTKRHIIDIKMSDLTTPQDLYSIMCKEEIGEKYIIPTNKRLLVFEDIDAMGKCVKSRDKEREKDKDSEKDTITEIEGTNINSNSVMMMNSLMKAPETENTLSNLLNIFDGINESSGRIIILTTNKPEMLDPALIRPGRIDLKISFGKCNLYDIKNLINKFWDIDITEDMLLPGIDLKYTSAEVYSIFRTSDDFDEIWSNFLLAKV